MKRFQFNLAAVLGLRKQLEEERKRALAGAQKELFDQQGRLYAFLLDEKKGKEELRRMEQATLDLPQVLAQRRYLLGITRRISGAHQELSRLLLVERQKRDELIKATKERKVLEKLKERKLVEHEHLLSVEEQKVLDEIANNSFLRELASDEPGLELRP